MIEDEKAESGVAKIKAAAAITIAFLAALLCAQASGAHSGQKEAEELKRKNAELEKEKSELSEKLRVSWAFAKAPSSAPVSKESEKSEKARPKEEEEDKIAYLTFDDGPSANTKRILSILDNYGVKATFFVNGRTGEDALEMYKRIKKEGHAIGNHTYTHDYAAVYASPGAYKKDFDKLQALLKETVGEEPKIMRFPGGSNNTVSRRYGGAGVMRDIAAERLREGYVYFDWNVDSTDADVAVQSTGKIIGSVLGNARGKKSINVLMHDAPGKVTTPEALPAIIEGLAKQGFHFQTIKPDSFAPRFLRP